MSMNGERLLNDEIVEDSSRSQNPVLRNIKQNALLYAILTGILVGVVSGVILSKFDLSNDTLELIGIIGELFINVLKLIVVPIVFLSMTSGICSLGKSKSGISKVASVTFLYYFLTTMSAVILGVILITIIKPGKSQPFKLEDTTEAQEEEEEASSDDTVLGSILDILRSVFPSNIVSTILETNVLGIITMSICLGLALNKQGESGKPIIQLIKTSNDVMITITHWVIYCAPFGIASIVAHNIAKNPDFLDLVVSLALFVTTIVTGLFIHTFIILPAWFYFYTRENSYKYVKYFMEAWTTALGTASSLATLPINLDCALKAGVSLDIAEFVLPIGATINMNGTAMYEPLAAIFIAQANGHDLSLVDTIIVAIVGTIVAVGAAGIPEAGIVTLIIVLNSVKMAKYSYCIAFLLTIDWFCDRLRTTVNVYGDSLGSIIVDRVMKKAMISQD